MRSFAVYVGLVFTVVTGAACAGETSYELQLPGVSHHFGKPRQAGKSWNEFHDGLGLQRTAVRSDLVWRAAGGFIRDSFSRQGLYAGGSIGLRAIDNSIDVEFALAPMLLYRTTRFDNGQGKAPYKLIPIVLPMIVVGHDASGIGINITALPAGNFGKDLRFPALIFAQFTWRIR